MTDASVSICIPAYQAEGFIERTLRFAAGQTLRDVRILVSIDNSTDRTEEICRGFAASDGRVEIITGPDRLGWGGNVNRLLDAVTTEFFFIYFHDDIILPQYAEMLLAALRDDPGAASANCTVQTFGRSDHVEPAHAFRGSMPERLIQLWLPDFYGMPLRSMIRRDRLASDCRLPEGVGGMKRETTFLAQLIAAGPTAAVQAPLYMRWSRDEGVLGSWRALPFGQYFADWQAAVADVFAFLDRASFHSESERDGARHVFLLHAWSKILYQFKLNLRGSADPAMLRPLLRRVRRLRARLPALGEIHPWAGELLLPSGLDRMPPDLRRRVETFHEAVLSQHRRFSRWSR